MLFGNPYVTAVRSSRRRLASHLSESLAKKVKNCDLKYSHVLDVFVNSRSFHEMSALFVKVEMLQRKNEMNTFKGVIFIPLAKRQDNDKKKLFS